MLICGLACAAVLLHAGCGFIVIHTARHVYSAYTKEERGVEAALERYRGFILAMQAEAAADMFAEAGELTQDGQAPVAGREAIRAFLQSSWADGKVSACELRASTTTVSGDQARQRGSYRRKVLTPDGPTVATQGGFEAEWSRPPAGPWALTQLHTMPGPAPQAGPPSPF